MPAPKKIPSISPTAINAYLLTLASRNVKAEKKRITSKSRSKPRSQKGGKKKRKTQKRRK